jgi:U4/U6 small nuclear ribonucleoprotein PRP4
MDELCGRCTHAGRLWDLRSGHSIMVLEAHVKGILSIDFAPNGYQL